MKGGSGSGGGGPVSSPSFVAHGAETVNASSFSLNPQALGAADGDTMVVISMWEEDTNVNSPSGWTNLYDAEVPAGTTARMIIDTITFDGSVPTSAQWSYGDTNGVAYAWSILSNVTLGSFSTYEDTTTGTGTVNVPVTAGSFGALVYSLADGASQTGESATYSGVTQAANDPDPVTARMALAGFMDGSGTATYTTTAVEPNQTQNIVIPVDGVTVYASLADLSCPADDNPVSTGAGWVCSSMRDAEPVWITAAGTVATITFWDSLSTTVTATDDSGYVSYTKQSGDAWISVNSFNGALTGTPPEFVGTYSITVRAEDLSGNFVDRTFDVVVQSAG